MAELAEDSIACYGNVTASDESEKAKVGWNPEPNKDCADAEGLDEKARIRPNISLSYRIAKRTFDIIASFFGLVILSPVFLFVALAIKIEDPKGRVLFRQPRFGIGCTHFKMFKFRSMFNNAEALLKQLTPEQQEEWDANFKLSNDPRITKVGKFIRRTSLDELPQLINILIGDMSVVGPRPPLLAEDVIYGDTLPSVMSVRPGLTGYWQAYGRSNTTFDERIQMNLFYIQNMSVWLDIKIIFKTFASVIQKEGAV